jgi:hypothetical protein
MKKTIAKTTTPAQYTYTIARQNHIAIYIDGEKFELEEGMVSFRSQAELEALASGWPIARLIEIWNRMPDNVRVKKFTNKSVAVRRIWKALEVLTTSAPGQPPLPWSGRIDTPIVYGSPATKSELLLALLRQPGGATLKALMEAASWQAHSVRGFISGQLTKKLHLKVKSFKRDGERVYSVRA